MDKNFAIRCNKCGWSELTTGIPSDMKHLFELPKSCKKCSGSRRFRCLSCGNIAKMNRIIKK